MSSRDTAGPIGQPSIVLRLFCLALMVPACAINGAFVALAIPSLVPYGIPALVVASIIGGLAGVFPGLWLAKKIHEGLQE